MMAQRISKERLTNEEFRRLGGLTNEEFRRLGGLTNGNLWRTQSKGGAWRYWRTLDNDRPCT